MTEWWEEAFRADYLDVYGHRDDLEAAMDVHHAAAGFRGIGIAEGGRVLDLACGSGRHLRALAQHRLRAVGADRSPELLAEARARGACDLVRCDMRRLPFRDGSFDAVTLFFNSFGYFETEEEDASVLREASRVLVPGGGLLLDLMDSKHVRDRLVPRSERKGADFELVEERALTKDGRRVEKSVTLRRGQTVRAWKESVRLYGRRQVLRMAETWGLRPVSDTRIGEERAPSPWAPPRVVLFLRKETA